MTMSDDSPKRIFEEIARKANGNSEAEKLMRQWVGPYGA